jgi:hypothetical protein
MATFWNSRKKGIFNLNGDAVRNGVDGSSQYANRKHAFFSVIDIDSKESVSFKCFIESFKISSDNQFDEDKTEGDNTSYKIQSVFSYDLVLDVPAHSTNEARNNLAKFAALERLISLNADQVTKIKNGIKNIGTPAKAIVRPNLNFAMANLIQDGKFFLNTNVDEVNHDKGIPGVLKGISFNPSMDMGFFEFDNKIIAKHYQLSLKIDCILQSEYGFFLNGFNTNGNISEISQDAETNLNDDEQLQKAYESSNYWPFGLMYGDKDFKNLGGDKYSSVAKMNKFYNNHSDTSYANNKNLFLAISKRTNNESERYVIFKAFLESFSYNKENEVKEIEDMNNPTGVFYNYSGTNNYSWEIKINVPSYDVKEAINNLRKINMILRMSLNNNAGMSSMVLSSAGGTQRVPRTTQYNTKSHVYVRLANFIFNPSKGYRNSYNKNNDIIETGLLCKIQKFDFDIDIEEGFYEIGNHFIPKVFSINLSLDYAGSDYWGSSINNYQIDETKDNPLWPHGMDWFDSTWTTQEDSTIEPVENIQPAVQQEGAEEEPSAPSETINVEGNRNPFSGGADIIRGAAEAQAEAEGESNSNNSSGGAQNNNPPGPGQNDQGL